MCLVLFRCWAQNTQISSEVLSLLGITRCANYKIMNLRKKNWRLPPGPHGLLGGELCPEQSNWRSKAKGGHCGSNRGVMPIKVGFCRFSCFFGLYHLDGLVKAPHSMSDCSRGVGIEVVNGSLDQ